MHDFGAKTANPSLAGQTGEVRSHRNSVAHGKFPQFVILNHAAFDFGNSRFRGNERVFLRGRRFRGVSPEWG